MSDPEEATRTIGKLLSLTRDAEMDCDEFHERLAAYVEGGITDAKVAALMEHHRELCPECEEEYQLLKKALDVSGMS